MRHLNDAALAVIRSLCPPNSHMVVIVATREGIGLDTSVPNDKLLPFLEEVVVELRAKKQAVENN